MSMGGGTTRTEYKDPVIDLPSDQTPIPKKTKGTRVEDVDEPKTKRVLGISKAQGLQ